MNQKKSSSLNQRIMDALEHLTPGERRLATVIRELHGDISSYAANELAERAQVSNATAARLFKRLGYDSYTAARAQARAQLNWAPPSLRQEERLRNGGQSDNTLAAYIQADISNLTYTLEKIPDRAMHRAVSMIVAAPRIWITGFRNSTSLALYARALLVLLKTDVRLIAQNGMSAGEDVATMQPDDLLIVIGFRRQPQLVRNILIEAGNIGMQSILVTDLHSAPLTSLVTVSLLTFSDSPGIFDSYSAGTTVINALCSMVERAMGTETTERLARIEALYRQVDNLHGESENTNTV
ncbi:MurR/RpiR family transcriptional regulator [Komagataeibacter saccharivorans]|uniref:MurR/RpiR family transcriptional regulator n=1 Tax=Komagataeibacter saccharivorans TaxID=265959 RepID=UPI0039ED9627